MILVSKVMVHRALSDKTYLSLGLLSPLRFYKQQTVFYRKFTFIDRVSQFSTGVRTITLMPVYVIDVVA